MNEFTLYLRIFIILLFKIAPEFSGIPLVRTTEILCHDFPLFFGQEVGGDFTVILHILKYRIGVRKIEIYLIKIRQYCLSPADE